MNRYYSIIIYLQNRINCIKFAELKKLIKIINMETTNTIRILNPSKELVAFIEKAQKRKKERIDNMRESFLRTHISKD